MQDQHALQSGSILDRYKIIRVLGEGGFGITYLAEDIQLGLNVVIKEYFPNEFAMRSANSTITAKSKSQNDFSKGMQRFKEEAQTLAKFNHPSIVKILGYFEANDTAYFVMEYEEGIDLSQYLWQEKRALSQEEILSIMMPILEGLKEVHKYNYLHRDIKPGNILLRTNHSPVLIDFGASKLALGEASKSITSMLTEGYAPLEQYSTDIKRQGSFTDLYAVGAVMYKMITGEVPPSAQTRSYQLLSDDNDPLKLLVNLKLPKYDTNFLKAIDRTLSIKGKNRPQDVSAFQADIVGELKTVEREENTKVKKSNKNNGNKSFLIIALIVSALVVVYLFTNLNDAPQVDNKSVKKIENVTVNEEIEVARLENEKFKIEQAAEKKKKLEKEKALSRAIEEKRLEKEKIEKLKAEKAEAQKNELEQLKKEKLERKLANTLQSVNFKKDNTKKSTKFSINDIIFSTKGSKKGIKITNLAKKKLGRRYVLGATGVKNTFDSSGFTMYIYKRIGIQLPRQVIAQSKYGKYISRKNLKPGDLIFFDTSKKRKGYVNHVGIYIGHNKFIHASSAKKKVVITSLNKTFYSNRYKGARRP